MSDADEIQTLHALNDAQAAEIARLIAERDAWRGLVMGHNAMFWTDEDQEYIITIPPELEQP